MLDLYFDYLGISRWRRAELGIILISRGRAVYHMCAASDVGDVLGWHL